MKKILVKDGTYIYIEGNTVTINGNSKVVSNVGNYFINKLKQGYIVVPEVLVGSKVDIEGGHKLLQELRGIAKSFEEQRLVGITEQTIERLVSIYNRIDWDNKAASLMQADIIAQVIGLGIHSNKSVYEVKDELYKALSEYTDFRRIDRGDVIVKVDIVEADVDEIDDIQSRTDFKYDRGRHIVYRVGDKVGFKHNVYYHGTRSENVYNLLAVGFRSRPKGAIITGSMFGGDNCIYFADQYKKSRNYTSIQGSYWAKGGNNSGFLLVCDVDMGRVYKTDVAMPSGIPSGYDSIAAYGGKDLINNEFITRPDRAKIRYVIKERLV